MLDEPLLQRCKTVFSASGTGSEDKRQQASIVQVLCASCTTGFQYETPLASQEMKVSGRRSSAASSNPAISSSPDPRQPHQPRRHFRRQRHLRTSVSKGITEDSSSRTTTTNDTPEPSVCSTTSSPTCLLFPSNRKPCSVKRTAILRASSGSLYFSGFIVPSCLIMPFATSASHQLLAERQSVSLRISMFRAKNQTSSCVSR